MASRGSRFATRRRRRAMKSDAETKGTLFETPVKTGDFHLARKFEIVGAGFKARIIRTGHNTAVDVWRFGQGIGQPDADILRGLYYYFSLDCISACLPATLLLLRVRFTVAWNILDKWITPPGGMDHHLFPRCFVFNCFGGGNSCFRDRYRSGNYYGKQHVREVRSFIVISRLNGEQNRLFC